MIKGNKIYFGYGDIVVNSDWAGNLVLKEITPPCIPGGNVNYSGRTVLKTIIIPMGENVHYLQLMQLIEHNIISEFEIDDYILDFSNFNIESIKVVRKAIDIALFGDYRLRAC